MRPPSRVHRRVPRWHARLVEAAILNRARRALDKTAISTNQCERTALAVTDVMRKRVRPNSTRSASPTPWTSTCYEVRGQTKMRAGITGIDVWPERVL